MKFKDHASFFFPRIKWAKLIPAARSCHLCHIGRQLEPGFQSSFSCSFCFSFCVCRRCHRHANGNRTVFTAHHEKSTPRFRPIRECKSKSIDRLASTTIFFMSVLVLNEITASGKRSQYKGNAYRCVKATRKRSSRNVVPSRLNRTQSTRL